MNAKEKMIDDLTFVPNQSRDKDEQKDEYMESFAVATLGSLVVKVADRLENIRDFLTEGNPAAKPYGMKGYPLFQAVDRRRDEVTVAFGPDTLSRIEFDITITKKALESQP